MILPDTSGPLCTDDQFNERVNVEHYIGQSPFFNTSLGLATQFPIDYMHLVCVGVLKRLLFLWTKCAARQGHTFMSRVSDRLVDLNASEREDH